MDQSGSGLGSKTRQTDVSTDWEVALHHFESLIACKSEALQVQAIFKLSLLLNRAPETILDRTVPILVDLLGSLSTTLSSSLLKASAYCLKCISCQGEGRLAVIISQSGAIPPILSLLQQSGGSLQRILLKCLRNIVTFDESSRAIVVRYGGVQTILDMLNSCPESSSRLLLEILSALALLREARRTIFNLRGVRFLVESAKCGSMTSRTRAAQAIGLLGLVKRARCHLVNSGAIEVLVDLLQNGDTLTKIVGGNALGVISSHVDYIRPVALAGAIPLYAELLQEHGPMGKEIAEDVFCILAVSETNSVTIVEHLVRIMRGNDNEAKAAAADVLWDLSSYEHALPVIRNSGSITLLVELLRVDDINVKEKVSGAIAQLSYNEVDRVVLSDLGVIPVLIDMLQEESEELRDNAAETLVYFSQDPLLCDRISCARNNPSFQSMLDRLSHMRSDDSRLAASVRQMSIEELTWNPGLV